MAKADTTTFFMLHMLPWADQPQALSVSDKFERAALFQQGFRTDCAIQALSALGAVVQAKAAPSLGARVTLELVSGQRPPATVAWMGADFFGVAFDDAIDVLAQINRNLVSQPTERRRMPRVELRSTGWLKVDGDFLVVTVRNISAGGIQLEGKALPPVGTQCRLYIEGLNVPPADLIWSRENLAGLQFRQELSWALIMPWLRSMLQNTSN